MAIFLAAIFLYIKKSRSDFRRLFLFINTTFLFLIAFELAAMIGKSVFKNENNVSHQSITAGNYTPCDECIHPDIYYLIFDAYTSSKVLRSEFGYENRLDSFLSTNKFFIVKNSRSNYNLTPFSIGSTLNFDYLYSLNTKKDFFLNEYLPGISIAYDNELAKILKKEGYQIFNHSIFNFSEAASTIPPFDEWEINLVYRRHNIFKKVDADIGWILRTKLNLPRNKSDNDFRYEMDRDKHVLNTLNALTKTIGSKSKSPKFIYGHLLLPHPPFTFDSAGNRLPLSKKLMSPDESKRAYVTQVMYVNKIIDSLVKLIFSNAQKPFVIILQGDHGFRFPNDAGKKSLEFANMNAVYFSNQDYRLFHDSITNVNTFRIVFNTFFKKTYPLLKDTSYFLQYR